MRRAASAIHREVVVRGGPSWPWADRRGARTPVAHPGLPTRRLTATAAAANMPARDERPDDAPPSPRVARAPILTSMARSALTTAMYRLPLWLHRLGLRGYERLIGIDWIVLTTRGRRSGEPRTVMLDAVGHDPATDTWYVQPADGRRAHWLRNALAHPVVTVEVRGRRFDARADDVTGDEGADVVLHFIRSHPLYARLIVFFIPYVDGVDVPD